MNKSDMDKLINETAEDIAPSPGHLTDARGILNQIKDAEGVISDLQLRLGHLKETLMSELGSEIRKRQPGMSIGINGGECKAGYRSMNMNLKPDMENGTWQVSGGPFARRFVREFPHLSQMGDDISPLAHAIADFFSGRYKSLQ